MSSQFTRYLHEKCHQTKTFYDHHKLPLRNIKTQDKLKTAISSQTYPDMSSTFQRTTTIKKKSARKQIKNLKQKRQTYQHNIGRNLFKKQIAAKPQLGPCDYERPIQRSNSFGYIQKQSEQKSIPSQKIKEKLSQFMGPGRYSYESSETLLSNHRTLSGIKFNSEKLIRCILSKEKAQKINLKTNQQIQLKQMWKTKLGPGFYKTQNSQSKLDKHRKTLAFSISTTDRSSLIKNQKLPGPGYYDWGNNFTENFKDKDRKPRIQYQSVHH